MGGGSLRIGSIAGIPLRVHFTFLLVLPLLALGFARVYTGMALAAEVPADELHGAPFLWGLVVAVGLFASVLVHELAHSLYALRSGGRVRDITLLMIGGVSQISEPPRTGRGEAVMALVGPLTSLVLGGGLYGLHRAIAGPGRFEAGFVLYHLFFLNVVLGLFNLLPAFPMDGGRILRGVLADRIGLLRATSIAAHAGKAFAALFAVVGFVIGNLILMLVAFFVWIGADAESRSVLVKTVLGHTRVRDLLRSRPEPVHPSRSVDEVAERMLRERRTAFAVSSGPGVEGLVRLEDVQRVPARDRAVTAVAAVARRVTPLDGGEQATRALRAFAEERIDVLPVIEAGALVGLLTQADVLRGLQLSELEATQHGEAGGAAGLRARTGPQHA